MSQLIRSIFKFSAETFFFCLFIAVYSLHFFLSDYDLTLNSMPKLLIGESTLNGIDVSKRVALFYKSAAIFTITFLLINGLINHFRERVEKLFYPLEYLTNISVLGTLILIASFLSPSVITVFNVFIAVFALSLIYFPLYKKFIGTVDVTSLAERFILILCLSVSLSFAYRDVAIFFFQLSPKLYFNEIFFLMALLVILIDLAIVGKRFSGKNGNLFILVLTLFPILSIISREDAWRIPDTKANLTLWIWLSLVGILLVFSILFRNKIKIKNLRSKVILSLVIGLSLFAFYKPVMDHPTEMFELANPVLSFDRYFNFNEWPLFESFNSHVLFELFFGFIYVAFHGYSGLDFLLYNFLHLSVAIVLTYAFLNRFVKDELTALLLTFFIPFLFVQFPPTWTMILIIPFLLNGYHNGNKKNALLWLALAGIIMIAWKIDLGYSSFLAIVSILVILYLSGLKSFSFREWIRPILVLAILGLTFLVVFVVRDIPWFNNLKEAYHYVSSAQAHGYIKISKRYGTVFFVHYFIFPSIIVLFLLYLIKDFKERMTNMPFKTLSVMFLSFFYLFNFHRGLIRHALIGSDDWISSFAFFIIPSFVFFIPVKESLEKMRLPAFLIFSMTLILAFAYPEIKNDDLFMGKVINQYSERDTVFSKKSLPFRVLQADEAFRSKISKLKDFMDDELDRDQTFYDYSNSPMLYHYLQRRIPSYFNQPLLSLQDEYLQRQLVKNLETENVPIVVYSNQPKNWYDAQDGVPKNVRHYLIGEYIHENFRPYSEVGGYSIWKRREVNIEIDSGGSNYSDLITWYNLKRLPAVWAQSVDVNQYNWRPLKPLQNTNEYIQRYPLNMTGNKGGTFLKMDSELLWGDASEIKVLLINAEGSNVGTYIFTVEAKDDIQLIRLSSQSIWYLDNVTKIEIHLEGNVGIKGVELAEEI